VVSGAKKGAMSAVWPVAAGLTVFFLAQQLGRGTHLFSEVLTAKVVDPFAALCKLCLQATGCVLAARCAARYEKGNPVRPAWLLVSLWIGAFFLGQAILSTYAILLGRPAPVPSAGDAFFLVGYGFITVGIVLFVRAYRASGFATGRIRENLLLMLIAAVVFAVFAYRELVPIALAPTPFSERFINVGYPVLDLLLAIPTLVLLRIAMRFRGGRVWPVWAALLTGILCGAGGDMLFADISPENLKAVGPLVDLLFILSYLFIAYGAALQQRLLAD
jgi:hypothetical protein